MRWLLIGVSCIALTACGKATMPGDSATGTADLAFAYSYTARIPSAAIADVQERQATACEQLGAPRCRITGMTYSVDSEGTASASLSMAVASPIARRFGREGVRVVEAAGGALTGAEITGADTRGEARSAQTSSEQAKADVERIDRALAGPSLGASERAELIRQRAAAVGAVREAARASESTQASIATTPISFVYRAGSGVGVTARLQEAAEMAQSSLVTTLSVVLMALAALGPPALLLLALLLLWRRWGRQVWFRVWERASAEELAG